MMAHAVTHKRRMLVGQLWLRGNTMRAIVEMVRKEAHKPDSPLKDCYKTDLTTVFNDIAKCKTDWIKRDGTKLHEKRAEQIARTLDVVHQAWIDFSNCKKGITIRHADGTATIEPGTWHMRPQYLRIALEAERQLAKLMGTEAPIQLTGADGEPLPTPTIHLHLAEGTVIKAPRLNGDSANTVPLEEVNLGGDSHQN